MELFGNNVGAGACWTESGFDVERWADAVEVKVLHSTFMAGRDATTCVTLIVHSESMEDGRIAALHDACLEAVRRASGDAVAADESGR